MRALSGTVAASTRSRPSGTTATSAAGSTSCSAYVPKSRSKPADQPGHPGAGREVDARTGFEDGAGEVPAETGVLGLVDEAGLVQDAASDDEVDRVDVAAATATRTWPALERTDREVEDGDRVGLAGPGHDGGAEVMVCVDWVVMRSSS